MLPWASLRLRQVSESGFQLMRSPGSVAAACGTRAAVRRPTTASATQAKATFWWPTSGMATMSPPTTLPSRMATKVPISTMPLPPVSSRSLSTCGR